MKPNIRLQILLALVCMGLILSLLTVQVQTASLCSVTVPAQGGTLTEGIVGKPQYLNPLLADKNSLDQALVNLIFDGLTRYDEHGQIVPALAQSWAISEDGLTITFILRDNLFWHDGTAVTTTDVAFTYRLLQNPNFPSLPGEVNLWQAVTITPLTATEIAFTLPKPYSPFLEATTRGIVPAHILSNVTAETVLDHPFNQSPIGTGPFMVENNNWINNGRLHLQPNPLYWHDGVQLEAVELRFYPTVAEMIADYDAGSLLAINDITPDILPQIAPLKEIRLFSAPAAQFTQLVFNLTDSGMPALQDVRLRQALAYGLDREQLVDTAWNGQGVPFEGPYLPESWAYNPSRLTVYATNPLSATALLDESGWLLAEDTPLRQQEGVSLTLDLLFPDDPMYQTLATGIAQQWAQLGIGITLVPTTSIHYQGALTTRAFDLALVEVDPIGDPDLYDFWSQEAIIRGNNFGGWNNRRASEALEEGRQLWVQTERQQRYNRFLFYYNEDVPALTLFQHIYTYGISSAVNQLSGTGLAEIGLIHQPRDRYKTMSQWFLVYRDVLVSCPPTNNQP